MLIKKITNFTLEKISPKYYQLLFNYYNDNKNHLEPWEPTRVENYYSLDFHIKRIDERLKLMNENKSMHLFMLNDSKSEIMGVCNYTKIKDGKCWLGYSISSKYEGRGYMYEGVIQGNEFMFREYQITQLKLSVLVSCATQLRNIID